MYLNGIRLETMAISCLLSTYYVGVIVRKSLVESPTERQRLKLTTYDAEIPLFLLTQKTSRMYKTIYTGLTIMIITWCFRDLPQQSGKARGIQCHKSPQVEIHSQGDGLYRTCSAAVIHQLTWSALVHSEARDGKLVDIDLFCAIFPEYDWLI